MSCYKMIILNYNHGYFDKFICMCYVLTLESNIKKNYMKELSKFTPFSKVTIQENKGFKKCKKNLWRDTTIQDLNDAYLNVFKHAQLNRFKNILILEDDFFFDNLTQEIADDIGNFITNNKFDVYNLGPSFHHSIPSSANHHRSLFYVASHGVIYSSHYIKYYIDTYKIAQKVHFDQYPNKLSIIKYKYYKPICFQLFPETENQKNWTLHVNFITKKFIKISIWFMKQLKMDTTHQPGYDILNMIGYMWIPFILLIIYIGCFNFM